MRIAIGQLWQKTNTFNRNPTTFDDFENWGISTGDDVIAQYGETGEIGGFLAGCREWKPDLELTGLARFVCWPWGRIDREAWKRIHSVFAGRLAEIGPVDAVIPRAARCDVCRGRG